LQLTFVCVTYDTATQHTIDNYVRATLWFRYSVAHKTLMAFSVLMCH